MNTAVGLDKVGHVQPTLQNALSDSFSIERYIPQIPHLYTRGAGRGVGHVQPCPTLASSHGTALETAPTPTPPRAAVWWCEELEPTPQGPVAEPQPEPIVDEPLGALGLKIPNKEAS